MFFPTMFRPGARGGKAMSPASVARQSRRLAVENLEARELLSLGDLLRTIPEPPGVQPYDPNYYYHRSLAADGSLAVIGAPYYAVGGVANVGSAFVYDLSTGALVATLQSPTPGQVAYFGSSVAISGTSAVVASVGAAYVFDARTGNLLQTLNDPNGPASGDRFGDSVAVSGNTIAVGAAFRQPPCGAHRLSLYV